MLGSPVSHSLSPLLHRAAYRALGLDGWSYEARELTETQLPAFLAGLDATWVGLSLTMPLKRAVLPLLDQGDELVTATGVCNTVVLDAAAAPDGPRRRGSNTDVHGIVAAFRDHGVTSPATGRVLGGGATAASAVAALARLGCRSVVAHARDPARAVAVGAAARALGVPLAVEPWPATRSAAAALVTADAVVATTPPGAADQLAAALPRSVGGALLDVAYEPWPSTLAAAWAAAGGVVVPGVTMLLHQAAQQVGLMTGRVAPLSAMRVALAGAREEQPG